MQIVLLASTKTVHIPPVNFNLDTPMLFPFEVGCQLHVPGGVVDEGVETCALVAGGTTPSLTVQDGHLSFLAFRRVVPPDCVCGARELQQLDTPAVEGRATADVVTT